MAPAAYAGVPPGSSYATSGTHSMDNEGGPVGTSPWAASPYQFSPYGHSPADNTGGAGAVHGLPAVGEVAAMSWAPEGFLHKSRSDGMIERK